MFCLEGFKTRLEGARKGIILLIQENLSFKGSPRRKFIHCVFPIGGCAMAGCSSMWENQNEVVDASSQLEAAKKFRLG